MLAGLGDGFRLSDIVSRRREVLGYQGAIRGIQANHEYFLTGHNLFKTPLLSEYYHRRGEWMSGKLMLGAHMSIAGGVHLAYERAARAGCDTMQIFLKNSNQWKARPLSVEDRSLCRRARAACGISPVVAHTAYLINPASPDPDLHGLSLNALVEEMERAELLEVPLLVMHPGSHKGAGEPAGIMRIAESLNRALDRTGPAVSIVLENTAGQGSSIGYRFEHLARILERVRNIDRVGFCLDTCHLFAAGYDIRSGEGYRKTLREFDRLVGIDRIRVLHLNDSRGAVGSRIDRHEHIGRGRIGLEAFRCMMNDRRFRDVPKILETPKGQDLREDRMNLERLRSLVRRRRQ